MLFKARTAYLWKWAMLYYSQFLSAQELAVKDAVTFDFRALHDVPMITHEHPSVAQAVRAKRLLLFTDFNVGHSCFSDFETQIFLHMSS